jgi:AcrR family transcriptional regulator
MNQGSRHTADPRRRAKQARSRRTRQQFITAMWRLLEEEEYSKISVKKISDTAHSTEANFYKHFAGKRELLSAIVDELQSTAEKEQGTISLPRANGFTLAKRIGWLVAAVADATLRRRRIVRACIAARYRADLVFSASQAARLRATMQTIIDWLLECSGEMDRVDPRTSVRAAAYLVLQGMQNALLFEELPPDLPESVLISEAKQALLRCLVASTQQAMERTRECLLPGDAG